MRTQKKKIKWNYKKCFKNLLILFILAFCISFYFKAMTIYNKTIKKNVADFTEYAEKNNIQKTEENYKEFINK